MHHSQSLLAEMRALEEKRAGGGLSPAEAARLAELASLGGPAPRGFDVNAAAAAIREEMVSATPAPFDLGALGPGTPGVESAVAPAAPGLAPPPPPAEPEAGPGGSFSGTLSEAELFPPEGFAVEGPGVEAPPHPLEAQGYDEVPSFDAGPASAPSGEPAEQGPGGTPAEQDWDPNRTARWDPAALGGQGPDPSASEVQAAVEAAPPAAWDPSAPGHDPDAAPQAGWDPDQAARWDPDALPPDAGAPPGYDPSAYPQEPGAAWDPNAPGYDPNAAPQAGWDPNQTTQWDSSAYPQDPGIAWDPGTAPDLSEPGHPGEPASSAAASPDTTAEWGLPAAAMPPAAETSAAEADASGWNPGGAPPAPSEETGGVGPPDGAEEEFRHEPPPGWDGEVGDDLLDRLEQVSSGSFPPIDLSVLADAEVELPPVPAEPEGAPLEAGPREPAPLTDVYALAEEAAAAEASRSALDFELPPVTPAEEAILEVGGDVQEVEADDLADAEPVELLEEVTRPVPEFADPLAEGHHAPAPAQAGPPEPPVAPPPRPDEGGPVPMLLRAGVGPRPSEERVTASIDASVLGEAASEPPATGTWEPDITVEEPPAPAPAAPPPSLAPPPPAAPALRRAGSVEPAEEHPAATPLPVALSFAEPPRPGPARPSLPPLAAVSTFEAAPSDEPVPLDAIGIEEAPLEAASGPAGAAPGHALEGAFRVVLHTMEGQVKRGTLHDPVLDGRELLLEEAGTIERLPGDGIRAIFFMLGAGQSAPAPAGRKVRVTFRDGRQVAGFSPDYDPAAVGFFMIPADTRTNTARIWVFRSAVRQVSVSD